MKRTSSQTIASVASQVLAEVEKIEHVKTAEIQAVRVATPKSDLGELLHKLAADLRSTEVEVAYEDIAAVAGVRS